MHPSLSPVHNVSLVGEFVGEGKGVGVIVIPRSRKTKIELKIMNIFLSISFNISFGCSVVLLSTHKICFWFRNKKSNFLITKSYSEA